MSSISNIITIDPEIQNGQAVFKETRVPVEILFEHLKAGDTLDIFLEDFPSVKKEQAVGLLEIAEEIFSSKNLDKFL